MPSEFHVTPTMKKDYKFDYKPFTHGVTGAKSDFLGTTETLSSYVLTVSPTGPTISADSLTDTNTSVTYWITGFTVNVTYTVLIHVITSGGREDEKEMRFICKARPE